MSGIINDQHSPFSDERKAIQFNSDYRNFGIVLTIDRDDMYIQRNEITLQLMFWTIFIRFNFTGLKF